MQRKRLEPSLAPYAKMNSTWVEELHVRPQSIKPLDENTGQTFTTSDLAVTSWLCHQRHTHQRKNRQAGPRENLKLLCLKGHRMGESICKSYLKTPGPQTPWNYLLEGVPLQSRLPPRALQVRVLGTHLRQWASWWWCERLCLASVSFVEDSTRLSISCWGICERTCPHYAERSTVFDQKGLNPRAPPSLLTGSCPKQPFVVVSPDEKVLRGKRFADVEKVNQNRSTKEHQKGRI